MGPVEAFLQAIANSPDDESLRLIFADYLEEHDEGVRAEFIRLQCEYERLPVSDPRRPPLELRCREILTGHVERWTAGLQGLVRYGRFRNGFPERITVAADVFLERAEELFHLVPVRHLHLTGAAPVLAELAMTPHLGRVTALDLNSNFLEDESLTLLLASPHLGRLRTLRLTNNEFTNDGARILAESPVAHRLVELDLGLNRLQGPDGLAALATSPRPLALTSLSLVGNPLTPAGLMGLLNSGGLCHLSRLDLSQTLLGDEGLTVLARLSLLGRLTHLSFGWNLCGRRGLASLAGSEEVASLEFLDLRGNRLNDRDVAGLIRSPHLRKLAVLDLRDNRLGETAGRKLRARFGDAVLC